MKRTIALHAAAPSKPKSGQPCNGCGVCCALETCPWGRLLFLRRQGPCPALEWVAQENRYRCGLVFRPAAHLRWLPAWLTAPARRWFTRRIAAGSGCDCGATIES